jgi:arylsulfatase A-like enzyme
MPRKTPRTLRSVLLALALPTLAVLGLATTKLACGARTTQPPNLILITLDTLRADRLGAYGHERAATPSLDAIAARGVRFEDAIAQATTTPPSHASILTGLNPPRHGLRRLFRRLADSNETLAEILRGEGYTTAAFVSAAPLKRQVGLDQGFDEYSDAEGSEGGREAGAPVHHYRPARATNEQIYEWLAGSPARPLFLWVHYFDPHTPYFAPEEFRRRFGVGKARQRLLYPSVDTNQKRPNGEPAQLPKPKAVARMSNLYDAEIHYMDTAIGELLDALGDAGVLESSVVVFVADHGEHLGEGGYYFGHWDVLEETARVPMVVAHSDGRYAGTVVEHPVGTVDLVPTLLGWLGVETPLAFDGVDLTPTIRGDSVPPRVFYTEQLDFFPVRAVRSGKWLLREQGAVGSEDRERRLLPRRGDTEPAGPGHFAQLSEALDAFTAAVGRHHSTAFEVSEGDRQQLRALGYIDGAQIDGP